MGNNNKIYSPIDKVPCNSPHRRSYTVDPAAAIFTGNRGMKCVMEHHNELREVDIQAAFDVDKHNSGEYVMV